MNLPRARRAITGEHGVAFSAFIDHHVHLGMIDPGALVAGGIAGVLDLGGDPVHFARLAHDGLPHIAYAGAFLTARGGYPADRPWAPPEIVREISDPSSHPGVPGGAATAVFEQASFGASVIKIALNADAGPVFDTETLTAVIAAARDRGLPVVAHVEGEGMTRLAVEARVDALAHTPFTELVPAALIAQAVAAGQRWISTIDIHRNEPEAENIALANLAAFVSAGGTVLYGTDLGNGDLPIGINARELVALDDAGVRGEALIRALTDPWPASARSEAVSTFVAGDPPAEVYALPRWLARGIVVPRDELIHD